MHTIKRLFRKDYTGEDVNITGVYEDREWHYQTEFISNPFHNLPLSNRAVVIGNGITRQEFDLKLICDHRVTTAWGQQSDWIPQITAKKFNTYGCNALYRDYKTDFLIATGDVIIQEIAASGYCTNSVAYAKKQEIVNFPGKFHVVPQDPQWNAGAIAAYLAAFDGNKKVFMLGFDGIDSNNSYNVYVGTNGYQGIESNLSESLWIQSLSLVMNTYQDVEFIRVAPTSSYRVPELWKYNLNFRTVDFRQFVLEADI
jgi:hypothetical protein